MSNQTLGLDDELYQYLLKVSLREHSVLAQLRQHTAGLEMARMQIAPEQGQFMALLIKLLGARRTIEVGVFTGYSTLATALALPDDGHIIACDVSKEWTDIAKTHWQEAGVANKIDLKLAPATDTLKALLAVGHAGEFDFAFIDADKGNYPAYYELCLKLIRPGGLVAIDNVLWNGAVANDTKQDEETKAIRTFNDTLTRDQRVDISLVPIADGLTLARKS